MTDNTNQGKNVPQSPDSACCSAEKAAKEQQAKQSSCGTQADAKQKGGCGCN